MTARKTEREESGSAVGPERPEGTGSGLGRFLPSPSGRSRRSLVRLLAALGIAIGFAVLLGLVVALVTNALNGGPSSSTTPPALAIPSAGGASTTQVPGDWVEQTGARGVTFRAPPGWSQRQDAIVDFRYAPGTSGPGVEQIGVGFSSETDPSTAATGYARNTYSGQPTYLEQPPSDEVSARGEHGQQVTLTYSREGTPVQVVVRAFPTQAGMLIETSRAGITDQQRAEELAGQLDASVRLP